MIIIYFFIIYFRRRILKKRFKNLGRSEQTNDILFQILNKIFPFLEIFGKFVNYDKGKFVMISKIIIIVFI